MTKPRTAVLYCRISDARDGDDHGVTGQQKRLTDHAATLGWGVGRVIVENDTSAFKRRKIRLPDGRRALRVVRPGWRAMLDDVAAGRADGLLALDLDRACRDPRDLEDLIDVVEMSTPRLPVESVTGSLRLATDSDVTMARVMVAVANKSSRDTARRVADARRHSAESGDFKAAGIRPFGFEVDGVTPRPVEVAEIRRATDALLAGVSLRNVTANLRASGVPTVTGKGEWQTRTVRDMLMRPRNAGLIKYKGEIVDGKRAPWEPVVPEEKWRALVALLSDPERRTSPGNTPSSLGGVLYECGHPEHDGERRPTMRVMRHSQRRHRMYRCSVRNHCVRSVDPLDTYVERVVLARLAEPDAADLVAAPDRADTAALAEEAATLRQRRVEAKDLWQAGVLSAGELKSRDAQLRDQLVDIERRLAADEQTSPLAGLAGRPDVAEVWQRLDLGRKRAVVRALLTVVVLPGARQQRPKSEVDPDDPLGRYFDPDAVRIEWVTS